MGRAGLEKHQFSSDFSHVQDGSGSKSGNTQTPTPPPQDNSPVDPDLAALIAVWSNVPAALRKAALAMLQAAANPNP